MNDFHNLSICIEKKDKHAAMMVFKNKSEFAARKILEKIKVRNIQGTGKIFWLNVQRWLLNVCRHDNNQLPVSTQIAQGNNAGLIPEKTADIHPKRTYQHRVADSSSSTDVCAWPEGFPPVHIYMNDARPACSRM